MPEYVVTSNKEMRKIVLGEQLPICYPCEMDGDDGRLRQTVRNSKDVHFRTD